MKGFKDLTLGDHPMGGVMAIEQFDNGYGVSVVSTSFSQGGSDGLYELAVLYNNEITYYTEITSDVLGYLSEDEVTDIMEDIQLLD